MASTEKRVTPTVLIATLLPPKEMESLYVPVPVAINSTSPATLVAPLRLETFKRPAVVEVPTPLLTLNSMSPISGKVASPNEFVLVKSIDGLFASVALDSTKALVKLPLFATVNLPALVVVPTNRSDPVNVSAEPVARALVEDAYTTPFAVNAVRFVPPLAVASVPASVITPDVAVLGVSPVVPALKVETPLPPPFAAAVIRPLASTVILVLV